VRRDNLMKKGAIIVVIVVAVLIIAAAIGIPLYMYNQNNYVAKVGDAKITEAEYKFYLMNFKENVESLVGVSGSDSDTIKSFWKSKSNTDGETWEEYAKKYTLDQLKKNKVMLAKAKEKNITLTKDEKNNIKEEIDNVVTQYYGGKRVEADKAYKSNYGVNLSQYETIAKEKTLIEKYQSKVYSELADEITDDEISQAYNEDPKQYDKISVRHILYLTVDLTTGESLTEGEVNEASEKANAMKAKVLAGEDMAKLAKENSQDPYVEENEGLVIYDKYGIYDKNGNLTATFASSGYDYGESFYEWAKDKKVGDVEIIETMFGYHVMKVENRVTQTLDEVKGHIKDEFIQSKFESKLEEWMKDTKYTLVMNDEVYNKIKIIE